MKPQTITSMEDFKNLLQESRKSPTLLVKLSPVCPTSFQAQMEFEHFLKEAPNSLKIYTIDVIAARATSRQLAEDIQVRHESPQAIFFKDGEVVWHGSHYRLNRDKFIEQANKITKP